MRARDWHVIIAHLPPELTGGPHNKTTPCPSRTLTALLAIWLLKLSRSDRSNKIEPGLYGCWAHQKRVNKDKTANKVRYVLGGLWDISESPGDLWTSPGVLKKQTNPTWWCLQWSSTFRLKRDKISRTAQTWCSWMTNDSMQRQKQ